MAFAQQTRLTDVETEIQLYYEGRSFKVRMDGRAGLGFWRVESDRRVYRSPVRIKGNETPEFFNALVQTAVKIHGL
jgi:hypothetical protein